MNSQSAFRADQQRIRRGNCEHIFDLFARGFRIRSGQINFVDHRNDCQVVLRREECICDGLRFHALARIDDEERAFAGGKRARYFVGKIHVARSIDQFMR